VAATAAEQVGKAATPAGTKVGAEFVVTAGVLPRAADCDPGEETSVPPPQAASEATSTLSAMLLRLPTGLEKKCVISGLMNERRLFTAHMCRYREKRAQSLKAIHLLTNQGSFPNADCLECYQKYSNQGTAGE
jgi:hypothetical protein